MILNYGAMNVGFVVGALAAGLFSYKHQYQVMFILLTIPPLICVILSEKYLIYQKEPNRPIRHPFLSATFILISIVGFVQIIFQLHGNIHDSLLFISSIGLIIAILYSLQKTTWTEKVDILQFTYYCSDKLIFSLQEIR